MNRNYIKNVLSLGSIAEVPNSKGQLLRHPADAPVVTRVKSVCAVVVTYNRKVMLAECITALLGQTREPDQIAVIENCCTDGTLDYLQSQGFSDHPKVRIIQMPANTGGAGGFAKAAEYASVSGFDWCWMMDDDVLPEPDCLQNLLERGRGSVRTPARLSEPFNTFHLPAKHFDLSTPLRNFQSRRELLQVSKKNLADDRGCCAVEDFAFEGLLISSDTIRRAGLPRADFFINADDYEYALRLRKIIDEKIWFVPSAIMHRRINTNSAVPGWKIYYGVRNRIIICKLYGENIIVRNEAPVFAILRVLFDLLRLKTKDTRYMLWAIADGIRMKTCMRFSPPAAQSD
jgi:rhamnopyranosyl-N-acetylglucosaminyl-diphospho-decaprenol beta-1,3/1,4-galactofuranosyltransferase